MSVPEETLEKPTVVRRLQRVPATFAQQRLWFMEQLQPGNSAYLIAWNIHLVGEIRADILERTLNEVVRRHKVFRTTFEEVDGDVAQIITSALTIAMPIVDLSGAAEPGSWRSRFHFLLLGLFFIGLIQHI